MTAALIALLFAVAPTTETARKLVMDKLRAVETAPQCREAFERERVDLELVRGAALRARFYNATGAEGALRFSRVIGFTARPDPTLRSLAAGVPADAFVLGYQDTARYVRTHHVVLNSGYFFFEQRPTTTAEKQNLLLHEVLHIALDIDDHQLERLAVCPLRNLAACPE